MYKRFSYSQYHLTLFKYIIMPNVHVPFVYIRLHIPKHRVTFISLRWFDFSIDLVGEKPRRTIVIKLWASMNISITKYIKSQRIYGDRPDMVLCNMRTIKRELASSFSFLFLSVFPRPLCCNPSACSPSLTNSTSLPRCH